MAMSNVQHNETIIEQETGCWKNSRKHCLPSSYDLQDIGVNKDAFNKFTVFIDFQPKSLKVIGFHVRIFMLACDLWMQIRTI